MNNTTEVAERSLTVSDLLVMDNELYAAIQGVADAWNIFQYGESQPEAGLDAPASPHRIERLHYDLVNYVDRLHTLERNIRSRS